MLHCDKMSVTAQPDTPLCGRARLKTQQNPDCLHKYIFAVFYNVSFHNLQLYSCYYNKTFLLS